MKDRIILHCDLNNFFASVSLIFNPTLVSLPVAVCGDKENRHGIVLAKNEIAKGFGVKTAEPIFEAKRKCPELVILPPLMDKYREYSWRAREIYARYTDMIEPFGIDECWLDVTGSTMLFGSGEEIAHKIRTDIKKELGVTISVGVSFNKVFAKLGSDITRLRLFRRKISRKRYGACPRPICFLRAEKPPKSFVPAAFTRWETSLYARKKPLPVCWEKTARRLKAVRLGLIIRLS